MPFYEYECSSCHHTDEMLQKISAAPLRKCPACGKNTLKRLISAPVFRLKGAGWYETDFKSDKENKRNLAGTQPEAAEKAEAKSETTSETTSEAKSEAKQEATPAASAKPESAKPESSKPESAKPAATSRPRTPVKSPGRSRRPVAQHSTAKRPAAKKRGGHRETR